MALAADLAGDVNVRFVGVEHGVELIVFNGEDICTLAGYYIEKSHETARAVNKSNDELHSPVSCHETALDDGLDKADVDITAGHYADNALIFDVNLAAENGGEGSCARGFDYLLAALHEQEYRVCNLALGDGDNAVSVAVYDIHSDVARCLDCDTVRNSSSGVGCDKALFLIALSYRIRALGLYAVDLDAGVNELDCRSDTGKKSSAARRDDDNVNIREVGRISRPSVA